MLTTSRCVPTPTVLFPQGEGGGAAGLTNQLTAKHGRAELAGLNVAVHYEKAAAERKSQTSHFVARGSYISTCTTARFCVATSCLMFDCAEIWSPHFSWYLQPLMYACKGISDGIPRAPICTYCLFMQQNVSMLVSKLPPSHTLILDLATHTHRWHDPLSPGPNTTTRW